MKKNFPLFAAVILSATLFSCKKEKLQQAPVTVSTSASNKVQVRIASDWLSLSLTNSVYSGASSLQGRHLLSSPISYDYNEHVQLAFARSRGREEYIYAKLPMNISTSQGNVRLNFLLDYSSFTINIWNTDLPAQVPLPEQFSNMKYRFIVIPKSIYQGLNIDWSDYTAVATALNL